MEDTYFKILKSQYKGLRNFEIVKLMKALKPAPKYLDTKGWLKF